MKKILFILVLAVLYGCEKDALNLYTLKGEALGTTYAIQYYSATPIEAAQAVDSIFKVLNASVSTYIPNSDISKINRGDSLVVIDSIFKDVYTISKEIHTLSQGYFDPTIGVLRNAYGFGTEAPIESLDAEILDSLRTFVGFQKVAINEDGTIKKKYPQIYFDFNAVAKGYGLDMIGNYFNSLAINNYLIELGGEILGKGKHINKNTPWTIGIEAVESSVANRSYTAKVHIKNVGLASSGNYRKFWIDSITGKKYVHTINPLSGRAEQSNVTSATVIAPTCALADAYATTFMAMGLQKSKDLLKKLPSVEAYLTYIDEGKVEQVFISEGMKNYLVK